jgi:hypothetical protein
MRAEKGVPAAERYCGLLGWSGLGRSAKCSQLDPTIGRCDQESALSLAFHFSQEVLGRRPTAVGQSPEK